MHSFNELIQWGIEAIKPVSKHSTTGPLTDILQTMNYSRLQLVKSGKLKSASGFTLLEIIVVITIIAILAAYIAPKVAGRADDARIAKAKSDIRVLESSMELYKLDNFNYPSNEQGLGALVSKPTDQELKHWRKGGYIKKLNKDPWGNPYLYQIPGANGEFDIYSLGADSTVGGTENAADIGNWNLDS